MKRRRDEVDSNWYDEDDFSYEEVPSRRRRREDGPDMYPTGSGRQNREPDMYRPEPRRSRRPAENDWEEEPRRRSEGSASYREKPRRGREEGPTRRDRSRRPVEDTGYYREETGRQRRQGRDTRDSREYREEKPRRKTAAGYRSEDEYEFRKETGKRRRKRKGGCCLGGCLIPVLIAAAVLAGLVYMVIGIVWGRVRNPGFSPSEVTCNPDLTYSDSDAYDDYELIMLYGVDSRDQDPLKTGALADSNILVAINRRTGSITMTSIYRDTCVETTQGTYMKLTEVYSTYGPKESLQTINRNMDLKVRQFVTVTWASVAQAINSLGGVDITVTAAEAKGINKYIDEVIKNTGIDSEHVSENVSENGEKIHLDGVQAVTFCRLRKGLGDDYKRTERQRVVISAAFSKAKRNPVKAAITAYRVLPQIASNISTGELMKLITGALKYDMGDNYGFPKDLSDGTSYVVPRTLESNDIWLHETVFGNRSYTPSDTVERISEIVLTK